MWYYVLLTVQYDFTRDKTQDKNASRALLLRMRMTVKVNSLDGDCVLVLSYSSTGIWPIPVEATGIGVR
jgi:hypothetical protein